MERKELINEITGFCLEYRLFRRTADIEKIKNRIEEQLEDSEFIESLINTIILKTKRQKNKDTDRLKELLIELEKIRLEIEYKE